MAVDEEVLWLKVAVKDAVGMAEGDALNHLVEVGLGWWVGGEGKEGEEGESRE